MKYVPEITEISASADFLWNVNWHTHSGKGGIFKQNEIMKSVIQGLPLSPHSVGNSQPINDDTSVGFHYRKTKVIISSLQNLIF